jgi:hypothetical protein
MKASTRTTIAAIAAAVTAIAAGVSEAANRALIPLEENSAGKSYLGIDIGDTSAIDRGRQNLLYGLASIPDETERAQAASGIEAWYDTSLARVFPDNASDDVLE